MLIKKNSFLVTDGSIEERVISEIALVDDSSTLLAWVLLMSLKLGFNVNNYCDLFVCSELRTPGLDFCFPNLTGHS